MCANCMSGHRRGQGLPAWIALTLVGGVTPESILIFASSIDPSIACRSGQVRPTRSRVSRCARHANWSASLVLLLAFLLCHWHWLSSAAAAESSNSPAASDASLPALPSVPKLEVLPPERADVDDLDSRLQRLQSDNPDDRKEAVREILEVRPKLVAAVLQRLDKLAARADRERMKRALAQVRDKSNHASEPGDSGPRGAAESRSDLLMQLVERARPKDEGWRELTELVALSRMLTQIGNVHAARGLVEIYVRFGEFMRVDVQNRLLDLKDGAVAALIEARRHRAEKVARWAERQLDRLGKAAPSEAIRTDNFEVLADVLRAYGRTKDPDAARIIVTYASSERFQLREAARQAIVLLGEVGIWQLRDAYESVVGKRPRRDWSWDRTARELFFEYDKLHAAKAFEMLEVGNKAAAENRLEDMAKAYDSLLARSPQFDQAATLAPGYFRYAEQIAKSDPAAAQIALVRVERLATDPVLRQKAKSLRDTLIAEQQLSQGMVNTYLTRRAIEQDPTNARAKRLLAVGDRAKVEALTARTRWLTSGAIGLTALIAIVVILLRQHERPQKEQQTSLAAEPPPQRRARTSTPPTVDVSSQAAATVTSTADASSWEEQREPQGQEVPAGETAGAETAPLGKPRDPFEDIF